MSKTVTSLHQSQALASNAVSRLEDAGIPRGDITVYSGTDNSISDNLDDVGVPRSDAHAYAEGVRRGGSLIVVKCDDDEVNRVISILDGEGVLDLNERQSAWNSEGWSRHESASLSGVDRPLASRSGMGEREEVIPIAEEELHVGKREVSHGRVRIHSHVVERPVQEQVKLLDETVTVERRPASGQAIAGSGDPFEERTVEVEERDEEAVISKQARVKEELVVHKGVEERTETVSDTVRRTEVDVEDDRATRGTGTTGSTDRR